MISFDGYAFCSSTGFSFSVDQVDKIIHKIFFSGVNMIYAYVPILSLV